jgi:hypothetical protein
MWLFTKLGFFSLVKKAPGVWHLRARVKRDLSNIKALALPGSIEIVKSYAGSDYPWRILLDKRQKAALFTRLSSIDYDNFKGTIAQSPDQRAKLTAYHEIWQIMRGTEEER